MSSVKPTGIHLDFGMFDGVEWSEERAADIYENKLQLAEFADKNDFFAFHLVEHHTTPLSIAPSPGILLSAVAQRTSRIRIGPLGFLLPFHNPLRLYHEICMLDHLCRGRLELGFARGVVSIEAERFGLPGDEERRDMMREVLDILLYCFNNETLDFEGKYYNYSGIKLWLKPYQDPYPPLWYPTANIEMIPWVAESGLNTCGIIEASREYREHFDLYKKIWAENKDNPNRINAHVAEPKIGMARPVYVADSDEEAMETARAAHPVWRSHVGYLFDQAGITIEPLERLSNFETLIEEETLIVGSPQTVADKIVRTVEDCGINYFTAIFAFGDITHQQVMRSAELFAKEVMPAFK